MASQVIVVGGGLSGLSSAHTVLERGGRVLVLDKNAFMGGNSTKATSGINGAFTRSQDRLGIRDSADIFLKDIAVSSVSGADPNKTPEPLHKVLAYGSGPAVEWLIDNFGLDLSLVSRLGGHSQPRTHRGKERFPGMSITYALMDKLEEIAKKEPHRARIITKAKANKLVTDASGAVVGVEYEKGGQNFTEMGPVILATGGFAADFGPDSILKQVRPDLLHLPTTNGEHATGDGIKMSTAIGANTVDMEWVQVHPTGLVHPSEPEAKVKFLAAEALRGVGGIMLDANGKRFCDELGRRDYVSGMMWKNKGPFRLVLNSQGAKEIQWHCTHYIGRGLMKKYDNAAALAKDMNVSADVIKQTFAKYNDEAKKGKDDYGKKFFHNLPFDASDNLYVAWITPVIHYCMGGVQIDTESAVINKQGKPIAGLWATGELCGGIHGKNRLGGNSLLDCVVFGRVSGDSAARFLLNQRLDDSVSKAAKRINQITLHINIDGSNVSVDGASAAPAAPAAAPAAPVAAPAAAAPAAKLREISLDEVAKHNTEKDCWVVVNGQVLDVTSFMKEHPGGKQAILLFAGKDATTEFNLLHKPDVVEKYAPETVIGTLKK